ncbi:hypothetical protein C7I85_21485 [Mesorhizobium soli]|uniref:Uncharacterized protein n=1 Tax=Pseudaminobacter soli (ex Li et al. 2025) TaxID=1295366 RepID=A0A2P7S632_9HYPH|nr:hypothetical protein C7I85_21485 [Mesorhizobium soli]
MIAALFCDATNEDFSHNGRCAHPAFEGGRWRAASKTPRHQRRKAFLRAPFGMNLLCLLLAPC